MLRLPVIRMSVLVLVVLTIKLVATEFPPQLVKVDPPSEDGQERAAYAPAVRPVHS